MANDCLVKKYKKIIANNDLLRTGEVKVTVFPNSIFRVLWNNFSVSKDFIRTISGTFTSVTETAGYTITAGANGCVIAISNKYDIIRLTSTDTNLDFEFDANQFEFCENVFVAVGRAKIKGNVNYLQQNGTITYFEYLDLSEADGYVDLAKASEFSLKVPTSSAFVTATGVFNYNLIEANTYKESEIPIPLSYIGSSVQEIMSKGVLFTGNIETDMPTINAIRVTLNGNITGQLEKWIEKEATVKATNSGIRVYSTSYMTLHNDQIFDGSHSYMFHFNADTVTVTVDNDETVIGTYTKATGTWSWV